jgi:hypothetical protein
VSREVAAVSKRCQGETLTLSLSLSLTPTPTLALSITLTVTLTRSLTRCQGCVKAIAAQGRLRAEGEARAVGEARAARATAEAAVRRAIRGYAAPG